MDVTDENIIVDAVVGKSLRKLEGCNTYIFEKVKQRVRKEVSDLVDLGHSQLDVILLQKKQLQAMFCSEKLLYDASCKRDGDIINQAKKLVQQNNQRLWEQKNEGVKCYQNEGIKDTSKIEGMKDFSKNEGPKDSSKTEGPKDSSKNEVKDSKNGDVSVASKTYFNYLAEYKNDADVYERVKGLEVRGRGFPVSNDGSCPRCSYNSNVFVVLDFLFPAGDMPEILHYLLTLGKAVLWSSKENMNYKDPPIFLCQGKCPADVGKSGFNINWKTTDLDKIFLFPHENYKEKPKIKTSVAIHKDNKPTSQDNLDDCVDDDADYSDDDGDNDDNAKHNNNTSYDTVTDTDTTEDEYDEGDVDIAYYKNKVSWVVLDEVFANDIEKTESIDEEAIIRNMLALEEARIDYINGEMKKYVHTESPEKESTNSLREKVVPINQVVNEINDQLRKTKHEEKTRLTSILKQIHGESFNTVQFPTTSEVITNAGAAAYAIANRENCKIIPIPYDRTKNEEKTQKPNTPAHILKGATYYNESDEVKTSKPAFTTHDFPISKNGVCPYCHSSDVVYIILQEDGDMDELPPLLERLHKEGKAVKRKKGEYDLPSFQCKGCTYGFNLDWKSTNLEKIFPKVKVVNPIPFPTPPLYTGQNVNASMGYAGYNNSMYNAYQQSSYIPHASASPYIMNAYGYMPPVAPVGISYQSMGAYQGISGIVSAYTNYVRSQYPGSNNQHVPIDFSVPPPPFHPESFRQRFPPPGMSSEYSFPPPPPASTTPSFDREPSKETSHDNTSSPEGAPEKKKNIPTSGDVDMDLDQDDESAVKEAEGSSELYDPFADIYNDEEPENENVSEECDQESSAENNDNTRNDIKEISVQLSPKNENSFTLPTGSPISEVVHAEVENIQASLTKGKDVNNEIPTTEETKNNDTATEPPKSTARMRTRTRNPRKANSNMTTESRANNYISNSIEIKDKENSETLINFSTGNSDTPVSNDGTHDNGSDTPTINTDTPANSDVGDATKYEIDDIEDDDDDDDDLPLVKLQSMLLPGASVAVVDIAIGETGDNKSIEEKQSHKLPKKCLKRKSIVRNTRRGRRGRGKKRK